MSNITLSKDQEFAFQKISKWLADGKCINDTHKNPMILSLGGYAGCGKTTLVSQIAKHFNKALRFAFCALSGRAASVLGRKLQDQGIDVGKDGHYCGTIHRLIYRPIENEEGEIVFWSRKDNIDIDVIVIDEASMVSEDIYKDLSRYGVPILAVGDHGQLPPIQGKFSLMRAPDLRLEKIHRQAEDNPIINLSMQIREHGKIPRDYKDNNYVQIIPKSKYIDLLRSVYKKGDEPDKNLETAVLCYTNTMRSRLNIMIRNMLFGSIGSIPMRNDLVICLKNDIKNRKVPLYNGFRGYLTSPVDECDNFYEGRVKFPFEGFETDVDNMLKYQFGYPKTFSSFEELKGFGMEVKHWSEVGHLFDFGYAMTVHKAQGSQMDNVIVFTERPAPVSNEDYKRWLYTAVSRATTNLIVIL